MNEFIEELEYNQKINFEKGLENRVDIDYVIERLKDINVFYEVCKAETQNAIEDLYNDELYDYIREEIENISEEETNDIARNVYDYEESFHDIYKNARYEILERYDNEDYGD